MYCSYTSFTSLSKVERPSYTAHVSFTEIDGSKDNASFNGSDRDRGYTPCLRTDDNTFSATDKHRSHASFAMNDNNMDRTSFTVIYRYTGHTSFTVIYRYTGHTSLIVTDRYTGHTSVRVTQNV